MNSLDTLYNLRGTEHLIHAREVLLAEGQAELQGIIDASELTDRHFRGLAAERALSRAESYDWFIAGRRAQAVERGLMVGHARFQYLPLEIADEAADALGDIRAHTGLIDELPGLWNFAARQRAKADLAEAYKRLAASFRSDVYGMEPGGELCLVHEENVADPYEGLQAALERERFVDNWVEFAAGQELQYP